ncbi:hypothetical protein [Rickettsia endosymbiont of Halotydeus destructor]|uniref:hypothetical protein n=1 Tax=Rickettsia endosymbiont of Halotydeus destructor TaxID=2996754 RepID=UPI003BAFE2A7
MFLQQLQTSQETTSIKTPNERLIEFLILNKKGLVIEACSLREDATTLSLRKKNMSDTEIIEIAEMLKVNSTLRTLDLGCNEIGDIGAKK